MEVVHREVETRILPNTASARSLYRVDRTETASETKGEKRKEKRQKKQKEEKQNK